MADNKQKYDFTIMLCGKFLQQKDVYLSINFK